MSGDFVCFLEEKSAAEMLRVIIPKLTNINEKNIRLIPFEGKQDLQKQIQKKLALYQKPNSVFLVMCDEDKDDCKELKEALLSKIAENKIRRTRVRIACNELESFYLGDLQAVEKGIDNSPSLSNLQNKTPYRTPDNRANPAHILQNITKNKYQKIDGSRSIAPHLKLDGSNKSKSFNVLLKTIDDLSEILSSDAPS